MIDPVGSVAKLLGRIVAPSASVSAATAVRPAASGADEVRVALPTVARALAATPPVNAERVAGLKAAIAAGTFTLDPAKTADRLLALRRDWSAG